ncbi:MAG: hypothetical protein JRM79_02605 [Nitrososphaerota archaeon]|jgi:hypothetical protein|nr:hypothetical protein [Nitrososphaerota archaeon]MDG6953269.1 hypothetical protein [Nitrososphaerota archaeon]MDG6958531.1 hypothetical protein [Nitrososphaerota archaeon]MDG6965856.1 hypothetical protein [Nitrososphaerota archaeon]
MVSTFVVAMLGGLAATATTAAATGNASAAASAVHAVPPGLQVALSHVPTASNAYEVLKQHISLYAGTGTGGTAATGGAAAAVKHGLRLGRGK